MNKTKETVIKMWREWEDSNPENTIVYKVQIIAPDSHIPFGMFRKDENQTKTFKREKAFYEWIKKTLTKNILE